MKTLFRTSPVILLTIVLLWSGCATNKVGKVNYAGKYNYTITTPMGDQSGSITLNRTGKTYTGSIGSDQGNTDLSNLVINGNKLTANFQFMSYDVSMKGDLSETEIDGTFSTEGYDIPFKAVKAKQ